METGRRHKVNRAEVMEESDRLQEMARGLRMKAEAVGEFVI